MICEEIQQLTLEQLSEPQGQKYANSLVEAHLAACVACQGFQNEMRELLAGLQNERFPEPGDLFFVRQQKQIEAAISKEPLVQSSRNRRRWYPAVAAAALLLVTLGYATFFRGPKMNWKAEWPAALSFLAQERNDDDEWLNFDDLSDQDLDIYARAVEAQVRGDEAAAPDEVLDIQDLDRQETDLLIKRLEAGLSGKNS